MEAEQLFAQAVARVPNSPLLVAGHAHILARCAFFDGAKLQQAEVVAQRALELGPELGEAHVAAGNVAFQQGRPLDALRYALGATSRSPSLVEAHVLRGRVLAETGPLHLAERAFTMALDLDPRAAHATQELARVMALFGRWERVKSLLEDPGLDPMTKHMSLLRFSFWRPREGDFAARSSALLQAGKQLTQSVAIQTFLGALAEATPDFEGIRRFMEKLDVGATGLQRHVFLRQIGAESFATSGYAEPAIEMVRRGVSAGLTDLMWLDRCPALDSIRADARFAEARAEVEARVRPAWTLVQS